MKIAQSVQTKMRNQLCIEFVLHSAQWGLLGAVLVLQSDSSREEGPVIPLLHTLGVYQCIRLGSCPVLW